MVSYVDQEKTTTPDIPLAPFVKDSIARGATSPDSFITSVQFGFEPWKGGAGLAVDDFTYSPTAERPVTTTPVPTADQEQPPAEDDGDDQGVDDGGDGDQGNEKEQPVAATASGRALVGKGGGRCVDVAGRSATKAAPVQLWTCQVDNPAQQWSRGDDQSVVNAGSGLCLDLARAATDNGARVQQWTCLPQAPGQQWKPGTGDTLVNPASGRCLEATDENTDNGTRLILWDCDASADNQTWTVR